MHRTTNDGDGRGSSQNDLAAEFLGDIDHYRQLLHNEAEETGQQTAEPEEYGPEPPNVQEQCAPIAP